MVLLGPSGSGKSTLLNILGGLDVPTAGRVHTATTISRHAGDAELTRYRREHVGFVFQFYNLIPSLTARENVALVTDIADAPDASGRGAASWSASTERDGSFPVADVGRRAAARGDRARHRQAARTCCCATSRPARSTTQTGMLVLEVIARINRELGTTTVVITHNAAIAGDGRPRGARCPTGGSPSIAAQRRARLPPSELQLVTRSTASCCATCAR